MPYSSIIPQSSDKISLSQSQIQNNFQEISTLIQENHINFDDISGNQGKHKWTSIPLPLNTPSTIDNEVGLYSSIGQFSHQPELTVIKQSNSSSVTFTETSFFAANPVFSWTRLPSGALLKWGFGVINQISYAPYVFGNIQLKTQTNNIPNFQTISNVRLIGTQSTTANNLYVLYFVNNSFDFANQTFGVKIANLNGNGALGGVLFNYLIIGT